MEKRIASPDSLASPNRIELDVSDQDVLSMEEEVNADHFTSDQDDQDVSSMEEEVDTTEYKEPFTYYREVLWNLIYDKDLWRIADKVTECGGEIVETIDEFLRTLAPRSETAITNHEALQHFDKVKSIWGNKQFLGVLIKMPSYLPELSRYVGMSKANLSRYLVHKIRSDPSFKEEDIFESKDKTTRMRNALSILIGYWSNEDMISLMLSIGGRSLRSRLGVVKVDDAVPWGKEVMSGEFPAPVGGCSPIEELRNDSYIKELADQLLKIEEAVSLADNYLAALKGDGDTTSYDYHISHNLAASNFWVNSVVLTPIVEALRKESKSSLVNIFKKYSNWAQCLRCLDRLTRIRKDSLLKDVLEEGDTDHKMRGALSVLFGYWSEYDVFELFRKLRVSRYALKEGDDVKVVEYFRRDLGDIEGLKNELAEKYPRDSEEYANLLGKIKNVQEEREQKPDHAKKIFQLPDRPAALVKVLLHNSTVFWMEIVGL